MKHQSLGCVLALAALVFGTAACRSEEGSRTPKKGEAEMPKVIAAEPAADVICYPPGRNGLLHRLGSLTDLIHHPFCKPTCGDCCRPPLRSLIIRRPLLTTDSGECRFAKTQDCVHRLWDWVTYRPLGRPGLCNCGYEYAPCCTPPLYTFFLAPCAVGCAGGPPCGPVYAAPPLAAGAAPTSGTPVVSVVEMPAEKGGWWCRVHHRFGCRLCRPCHSSTCTPETPPVIKTN
jgi:hypothetical protein